MSQSSSTSPTETTPPSGVGTGSPQRAQHFKRVAIFFASVIGVLFLFFIGKVVSVAVVGSTPQQRIKTQAHAAVHAMAQPEGGLDPQLESLFDQSLPSSNTPSLSNGGPNKERDRPRSWAEIRKDPAYQALAPERKIKLLRLWIDDVTLWAAANVPPNELGPGLEKLKQFHTTESQEIRAAAVKQP